jgi:sulfite reductase (NADPH) flavoprotein alpha-component
VLEKLDMVFSRDQAERRYVQDCLAEQAEAVRAWVAQGAAIYVCGSLEGMAAGVDAALAAAWAAKPGRPRRHRPLPPRRLLCHC